ncbi:MAG: hypothetical protein AAGJ50_09550 [Pseudomonadota bacterium]
MSDNTENNRPRSPLDGLDPLVVEQLSMATDEQLRFSADVVKFGYFFVVIPALGSIATGLFALFHALIVMLTMFVGNNAKLIDMDPPRGHFLIDTARYDFWNSALMVGIWGAAAAFLAFMTYAMWRGQKAQEKVARHYKANRS